MSTTNKANRKGRKSLRPAKLAALEFFAGSGLAGEGFKGYFQTVWANDNCPRKAAIYTANHPSDVFQGGSIVDVEGQQLPQAALSWASFPCQDLSLAGNLDGIENSRSGLVWDWLRVMGDMDQMPPLLVAENVVGLLSAAGGAYYRQLHKALSDRGYRAGAVVLDAKHWIPQSRPRVFIVAAKAGVDTSKFETSGAIWCHPPSVQAAAEGVSGFVWWKLPKPNCNPPALEDLVDFSAPCDSGEKSKHILSLISPRHREKLKVAVNKNRKVFPAYRRTRSGQQFLELRFDGIAGCLRTPGGGSSRQHLVLFQNGELKTRLLTVDETARLMGVRKSYKFVGSYNDGYKAMGDAVAVPAVRHLSRSLLYPLATKLLK